MLALETPYEAFIQSWSKKRARRVGSMDLEGLRECALLLEEEDMLMEPSAKPEFLVEDIMPERDRFIGVVGVVVFCLVLWCWLYVLGGLERNQICFCGMFRCL